MKPEAEVRSLELPKPAEPEDERQLQNLEAVDSTRPLLLTYNNRMKETHEPVSADGEV